MNAREAVRAAETAFLDADYVLKAQAIWAAMNSSEKHGVRFGLFPETRMRQAESEGYTNGHRLVCALMDCAKADGGMRA